MGDRRGLLLALAIVAATVVAYASVLASGFVAFDDDLYVTERPEVMVGFTLQGWKWAWTTFQGANWFPLTRLSWMLDAHLFGLNASAFHATSLLLHLANALLLFEALRRLTREPWPSAFVAALFALHPLHVESVAWISARKDVLSGFFFGLALLLHERRARSQAPRAWAVALFVTLGLGLLAKPMLVTLPCVLLLLDFWPLRRLGGVSLRPVLIEKLPLFALAAAASVVTLVAQHTGGALQHLDWVPLWMRVEAALDAYLVYLWKFFWPFDLAVFYPHPHGSVSLERSGLGLVVLSSATAVAWLARRRHPYLLVGWLWFAGMLVPVIGLVQVGQAALADRYTYLPLIGLGVAIAWGAKGLAAGRPRLARAFAAGALVWLVVLGLATHTQVHSWRDTEALFRHALRVTERNHVAHTNLAVALAGERRFEDAEEQLDTALALESGSAAAWGLRGETRLALERHAAAAADLEEAIRREPGSVRWRVGLGRAQAAEDPAAAAATLRAALVISPDDPAAHVHLAELLAAGGEAGPAIVHYRQALIDPVALGVALGRPAAALVHARLGALLAAEGDAVAAAGEYRASLALGGREVAVLNDLAWFLATGAVQGNEDAVELAQEAVKLSGGEDPGVLDTLATAQAAAGRTDESRATARRALSLARAQGRAALARAIEARFPGSALER
ncbi:MAG: hypothetical protein QF890_11250 [Myxococcota bacterium]|jgi:tetratricopeptide (TPR) repeat protein|nr:hypothetical protein [Deltaproteobacteria bacterium]MCP4239708.1 hypothetical protein [bacterium]MDP6074426.1 hypothetical protein [Myxococcota bacterium]MDP6244283.1 hypothetical protein [Myxococcota bacterium]MDP7073811.1 hypothetical protein [Myxococcota bacterium]